MHRSIEKPGLCKIFAYILFENMCSWCSNDADDLIHEFWTMTARRNNCILHPSLIHDLGFDFVLSLEHLVDFC